MATPIARSNYRQLRLHLTEYRDHTWRGQIYLKPYSAEWNGRHFLGNITAPEPCNPQSFEDAILLIVSALDPDVLPR